jgi:TPR repeat protein
VRKRLEVGDAQAIYNLGCYYAEGIHGFSQDMDKVFELWHRAGKLGFAAVYFSIGCAYF